MSLHSQAVHGCCCYEDRSKCKIHRIVPDAAELVRELAGQPSYEALKAENERLRTALRSIWPSQDNSTVRDIARAALEPRP